MEFQNPRFYICNKFNYLFLFIVVFTIETIKTHSEITIATEIFNTNFIR